MGKVLYKSQRHFPATFEATETGLKYHSFLNPVLGRHKLHVVELHSLTTICCNLLVVKLHSYFVLRQVIQLLFGSFFVV